MSERWTFGRIISVLWSGVDGVRKILHLLILLFIFSIVLSAFSSQAPVIPERASLVIRPVGSLVDQLEGDPYDRALQELLGEENPQTLVQDIVDGFRYAKDDPRIRAVVLDLSAMPGGGLSKLDRIAVALEDFQSSGKPVIATADVYGQAAYYLAARANEAYLHPEGLFLLRGFGIYSNYYKGLLDKLRVDWNVFKVGTHKSAPEPFTREGMSDENRESMSDLLDQLWFRYSTRVSIERSLDEDTIENLLSDLVANTEAVNGDLAQLALDFGFVDGLLTREEFRQTVNDRAGTETDEDGGFPVAELGSYLKQMRLLKGSSAAAQNVAVIVAAGEILNGSQPPGTIGGDSTAALLRKARLDESVNAVVMQVDSPGGSAFASEIIRNEVEAIKADGKPVVVSMSSVAASGGYWISMAADRIYAATDTITGSIGIFGMFPTYQRTLDAIGVTIDGVGSTFWAGEFRPDREMTDESKAMFQLVINNGYDDFVTKVAMYRGIDQADMRNVAEGRVWSGIDAYGLGLVDDIGHLEDAIVAAAELAGMEEGGYGLKRFEKELSPGERFALDLMSSVKWFGVSPRLFASPESPVERMAGVLDNAISPLLRLNDPKGIYAHCFCRFE